MNRETLTTGNASPRQVVFLSVQLLLKYTAGHLCRLRRSLWPGRDRHSKTGAMIAPAFQRKCMWSLAAACRSLGVATTFWDVNLIPLSKSLRLRELEVSTWGKQRLQRASAAPTNMTITMAYRCTLEAPPGPAAAAAPHMGGRRVRHGP